MYIYKTKSGLEICRSSSKVCFSDHFKAFQEAACTVNNTKNKTGVRSVKKKTKEVK